MRILATMDMKFAIEEKVKLDDDIYLDNKFRPINLQGHYVYWIDINKYLEKTPVDKDNWIYVAFNKYTIPFFEYKLIKTCDGNSLYDEIVTMNETGYNFSILIKRKYIQMLVDFIYPK